jgi:uncharacterized membrane protein YbaN (DUF454 family)
MKTIGIILVILGALSVLGAIIGASHGHETQFSGLVFVVLGAFLISRANKKIAEEQEKKQWESS